MSTPSQPWRCTLAVAVLTITGGVACSGGTIGDSRAPAAAPAGQPDDSSGSGVPFASPSGPGPGLAEAMPPAAAFAPAEATLRKLTVAQYRNSVTDLLGGDIAIPSELEPDTAQNGFYAIAAAKATISPVAAEKFEAIAYDVAAQALAPDRRDAFVGCSPSASIDTPCTRAFVSKLGSRAFRRPLTEAEIGRYVALAEEAARALGDFHAGLEFAIAGFLQSPQFLFRVELGAPDPQDGQRLRFDDYELASRLSYTLWNTTPDQTLLDAAARHELTTPAGLAREADRLLASERAKHAFESFHAERLGLSELDSLTKTEEVYASLDDELRAALRDDLLQTIGEYASGDRDFLELFETNLAFVTPRLADIYGMRGGGAGLVRVEVPASAQRAGLLGKPGFLALNAHSSETSPTLRGKYIRQRVLCESIPAPPPNVVPVLSEPDPNAPTMRDRLKVHAVDPACNSCHAKMDPLGLALEHFDAIGRYRADDHGHALDTRGDLDGVAFEGALELSSLLRDDPRTAACIVRQLYRYATAHVESDGEAGQIQQLIATFRDSGHDFGALVRGVVQSEGFRYAAKESAP